MGALVTLICLLLDVLIFIFLLAACITGIFLANGITDPVGEAVQKQYCDDPRYSNHIHCTRTGPYDKDNSGITVRASGWLGIVEMFDSGAPPSCKEYNDGVLSAMSSVAAAAATCTFSDCGTAECEAVAGNTEDSCKCLAAIAPVEPMAAQAQGCVARGEAVCSEPGSAPDDCATPAPQATVDEDHVDFWTAVVEGDTPSTACTETTGCEVQNPDVEDATCEYVPAMDARVRVHERAERSLICPSGCLGSPAYPEVVAVPEACLVLGGTTSTRAATCRACTDAEGTASLNDATPRAMQPCATLLPILTML